MEELNTTRLKYRLEPCDFSHIRVTIGPQAGPKGVARVNPTRIASIPVEAQLEGEGPATISGWTALTFRAKTVARAMIYRGYSAKCGQLIEIQEPGTSGLWTWKASLCQGGPEPTATECPLRIFEVVFPGIELAVDVSGYNDVLRGLGIQPKSSELRPRVR